MDFKKLIGLLLVLFIGVVSAENLRISVEGLNFFESENRTLVDVNYSIKYNDLTFKVNDDKSGAIAGLRVEVKIVSGEKILHQESFAEKIIITTLEDIESTSLEHIDRYSFDYASPGNMLEMTFIDLVSNETYIFKKVLPVINDKFISDVELNDYITKGNKERYQYMYRGDYLYKANPSRIFYKETSDSVYCYFQLTGLTRNSKIDWKYNYSIEIKDGFQQQVDYIEKSGVYANSTASIKQGINIEALSKGIYYITVKNMDKFENNRNSTDFSISDYVGPSYNILADLDDEYQLMKYFGYSQSSVLWKNFLTSKKRREINQFWMRYSNAVNQPVETFLGKLKEKVEYANRKYSHHKQGWSSDRGKIYILFGAPDEIEKFLVGEVDATDKYDSEALIDKRAVFNDKEYEIWRYTSTKLASYTFFDINMNNSHKLVYVYNDPNITVSSDYKFYFGQDFDENRLK